MRREHTEGVKVKDSNYTNKENPTGLQHTYTRWIWTYKSTMSEISTIYKISIIACTLFWGGKFRCMCVAWSRALRLYYNTLCHSLLSSSFRFCMSGSGVLVCAGETGSWRRFLSTDESREISDVHQNWSLQWRDHDWTSSSCRHQFIQDLLCDRSVSVQHVLLDICGLGLYKKY